MDLNSDPAAKQIILALNDQVRVLIRELDDTHLIVQTERVDWIRSELEKEVCMHGTVSLRSNSVLTRSTLQLEKHTWKIHE